MASIRPIGLFRKKQIKNTQNNRVLKKANISLNEIEEPPTPEINMSIPKEISTPSENPRKVSEENHYLREFVEGSKLIAEANKKLFGKVKEYEHKLESLKALEKENLVLRENISEKDKTLSSLNQAVNDRSRETEELKRKLDEKNKTIIKLSDELKPLKEGYAQSISVMDEMRKREEKRKDILRKQNVEISRLSGEPKKEKSTGFVLGKEGFENLRKESENESLLIKDLYSNVELLKERNVRKEEIITILKNTLNKLDIKSRDKDRALIEMKNMIGALRIKISQIEKQKNDVTSADETRTARISELTQKIDELKSEIHEKDGYYPILSEIEKNNVDLEKEDFLRGVESELILLRAENKQLMRDVNLMNKKLDDQKGKEKEVLSKLKSIVMVGEEGVIPTGDLTRDRRLKECLDLLSVALSSGDSLIQAKNALVKMGYDNKIIDKAVELRQKYM